MLKADLDLMENVAEKNSQVKVQKFLTRGNSITAAKRCRSEGNAH